MRILIRAQIKHDKAYPPSKVILENMMGGNNGNWLYQYSLYRTLMVDDSVKIDIVNFKTDVTQRFIDRVNEKYDMFILPLANAFKASFTWELEQLVRFVKGLKIPCYIIGVGIQAAPGTDFYSAYKDKELARQLVAAALERSNMVGVRGEMTGDFLEKLGFKAQRDFTVIGCPSMYLYGAELPETKPVCLDESDALFLYHSKVEHEKQKVVRLMKSAVREHDNYIYAPQKLEDIYKSYFGRDYRSDGPQGKERFFDRAKTVAFTNPYMWIKYLSENASLSFGTRFHGSVAAILAGVPSFVVCTDRRVEELTDYHGIAHIPLSGVQSGDTMMSLLSGADFGSVHKGHRERFEHYVDFLEKNGIDNIFSRKIEYGQARFDKLVSQAGFSSDVKSFWACSPEEKVERVSAVTYYYRDGLRDANEKIKALKSKKPLTTPDKASKVSEFFRRLIK